MTGCGRAFNLADRSITNFVTWMLTSKAQHNSGGLAVEETFQAKA